MASAAIFSSLRRRRSPSLEAFLAPVDLSDVALVQTLVSVTAEIASSFSDKFFSFQKRNSRSLVRKVEIFLVLLEYLRDSGSALPWTAVICLKELYLLLYRSKILLDYCAQSSKLWLLLQNHPISGHFHDLNKEISTLLDVFPMEDVELGEDVREQIELLQRQARRAKLLSMKEMRRGGALLMEFLMTLQSAQKLLQNALQLLLPLRLHLLPTKQPQGF
ncbi:U-box domain-containing protein 17 [Prunus yedoensis var. nudiflora]|uniref:U-box domain-containing protein 17 n=1 Tax=Prunus yedoensis var. nudiflora TaxID=2094558 RepID=A0A314Y283_PRUYE|nr:U-box domain-containing protein 17 [Prunus yedoensis var. nudiflora]